MAKRKEYKDWINRDDGKFFQIGNKDLGILEVIGYLLLVLALIIYLLHDKAGVESTWVGWLSLILGLILLFWSVKDEDEEDDKDK